MALNRTLPRPPSGDLDRGPAASAADDRSMRGFELVVALASIVAAIVLALARAA